VQALILNVDNGLAGKLGCLKISEKLLKSGQ